MNTLQFVEKAKSSDITKGCLCEVYRDTNHFVATDGHRLHLSTELSPQTPSFLSNTDGQFPDYRKVIPQGEGLEFEVLINRDIYYYLKTAVSMLKKIDRHEKRIQVSVKYNLATFKTVKSSLELSFSVGTFVATPDEMLIQVNALYLFDALLENKLNKITFYADNKALKIEHELGIGIIMPLRLQRF